MSYFEEPEVKPSSLTESVKPCLYSVDLHVSLAVQNSLASMSQHYPH